jgi:hypothetical protein
MYVRLIWFNRNEDLPDLRYFVKNGKRKACQNNMRQELDSLTLVLRMVVLDSIVIAQREKEM